MTKMAAWLLDLAMNKGRDIGGPSINNLSDSRNRQVCGRQARTLERSGCFGVFGDSIEWN